MTIEAKLDQQAFETLAHIYPHEAYESEPDKFWAYFRKQVPGASREEMVKTLKETGQA